MSTAAVWQGSDAELLAELSALETCLHSTWADMLSVIAEVDSRGTAETVGYRTTVDLVRAVGRVSRGEARSRVAAAADVLPGRGLGGAPTPPRLPATAAAVAEHAIGPADVTVIRSVLARIPAHVDDHQRAEIEAELAKHSRTLDATQLAVLGTRILAHLGQDGPPPKDDPEIQRRLTFTDRDGGYELGGWLDREAAEILRSALSPLAAPRPTTDTEVDLRTSAHRDADALVELAQRSLDAGDLPTEGGERPQVVVTVPLAVLQGRIGTASLALGGPINADTARRIACDARIIPVVLGARGEPLDIGRASYTVPTAIRRAVILRDGGCAFPGCSVPARWCDIHHVTHWANHGTTSVGNCVALCGRHHRLVHHSQWRIDMTGGIPQFHPPPWLGGPPRRNPLHTPGDLIRIRE
ncbi:MAG: HNH endonuclease [Pseudonocardiales bacterium]|nr:MAG: HNH endonuclease [Pseudonocardiales bacterium]